MLPNEMWEQKAQDPRIIRHLTKGHDDPCERDDDPQRSA